MEEDLGSQLMTLVVVQGLGGGWGWEWGGKGKQLSVKKSRRRE